MNDVFGYIAYGDNELYHLGALLSALKLLHHCPGAKIIVATDRPAFFRGYPLETILVSAEKKNELSFDWRYHFGIKAGGLIKLLKRADRLLFMDTDMYPVGNPSRAFEAITPCHSIMRLCEGPHAWCPRLEGKGVRVGDYVVTGHEPMWNSGILGVHRDNLPALLDAYPPMLAVHEIAMIDAAEQFCIGIALSQDGRTISPHRLKIRNYNTRGKRLFAGPRVHQFFNVYGDAPIAQQIKEAARYRLWRTPIDLWRQRHMWSR